MKKTFVLDTNVLISALFFGGNPRIILERCVNGRIQLVVSENILEELSGVLEEEKFIFPKQLLDFIIQEIKDISIIITPKVRVDAVKDDPDDNKVLECAIEGQADYIISGDRHLLSFRLFGKIPILSPKEFLTKHFL